MLNFEIITFDVQHGNCHVLTTPNEQHIMIDAGCTSEFSPAQHLRESWNVEELRWLTITHHDFDHIADISGVDEHTPPRILEKPNLSREQLETLYEDGLPASLEVFLEFEKRFTTPCPPMSHPTHDWGRVQFATFRNDFEDFDKPSINDLSVVTFANYMGWTIVFPGDLERQGWLQLLKEEEFRNWIGKTNIFVASHHGREAGYCEEVFEYCKPHLTIISDKSTNNTSLTEAYSRVSSGLKVRNRRSGLTTIRKTLTTRVDGAIRITIDVEGRHAIVSG